MASKILKLQVVYLYNWGGSHTYVIVIISIALYAVHGVHVRYIGYVMRLVSVCMVYCCCC